MNDSEETELSEKPKMKRIPDLDEDEELVKTLVGIPKKMYDKLGKMALEREISKGALIREAVADYFALVEGFAKLKEKPIEPNPEAKVSDEALNKILDECGTFWGGFEIEYEEGFIALMKNEGIKLKDLTPEQFEKVCDKLVIGYKGYIFRPSIEDFIAKFDEIGITEKQKKILREKLEAVEKEKEEEEW